MELESDQQELLIRGFSNTELKEVLDELYLDDAVDIVEEMPASTTTIMTAMIRDKSLFFMLFSSLENFYYKLAADSATCLPKVISRSAPLKGPLPSVRPRKARPPAWPPPVRC